MTKNRTPKNPQTATEHPGAAHFEAMKGRFMDSEIVRVNLGADVESSGQILIEVQEALEKNQMLGTLKDLPKALYDAKHVGDFAKYGWALRYIATKRRIEIAEGESTRVPAEIVAKAEQTKARMLKLASHLLGDNELYKKEIESIREGRGYEDLAQDLVRLARLYRIEDALLSTDPIHYKRSDADDAQELYTS